MIMIDGEYDSWASLSEPLEPTTVAAVTTTTTTPTTLEPIMAYTPPEGYKPNGTVQDYLWSAMNSMPMNSQDLGLDQLKSGAQSMLTPEMWSKYQSSNITSPEQNYDFLRSNSLLSAWPQNGLFGDINDPMSPSYSKIDTDDGMGDIMTLLAVAAIIYTGGAAAGLWGGVEGAAAAGLAEGVAAGGAMDMGIGLSEVAAGFGVGEGAVGAAGAIGDVSGLLEGGAANATATLAPEVASPGLIGSQVYSDLPLAEGMAEGAAVPPAGPLDALTPNIGDLPPGEIGPSMPPATPPTAPPGSTTTPFESASGAPATVTTVNPAPAMIAPPVSLVDKTIEWAGKQVGSELIKDAIAPDAPTLPAPAAAPAKAPFSFFGGLPWKAKAASGAPGLTRLSTGKSVFGPGALASPGGIVSNWMGRG